MLGRRERDTGRKESPRSRTRRVTGSSLLARNPKTSGRQRADQGKVCRVTAGEEGLLPVPRGKAFRSRAPRGNTEKVNEERSCCLFRLELCFKQAQAIQALPWRRSQTPTAAFLSPRDLSLFCFPVLFLTFFLSYPEAWAQLILWWVYKHNLCARFPAIPQGVRLVVGVHADTTMSCCAVHCHGDSHCHGNMHLCKGGREGWIKGALQKWNSKILGSDI